MSILYVAKHIMHNPSWKSYKKIDYDEEIMSWPDDMRLLACPISQVSYVVRLSVIPPQTYIYEPMHLLQPASSVHQALVTVSLSHLAVQLF